METVLIAAVADNGVIGDSGQLPWDRDYPEDLQQFRQKTMGSPVIMGRTTYESIIDRNGAPLDGRDNIVLSNTLDGEKVAANYVARNLEKSLTYAKATGMDSAYVIGGASVYQQALAKGIVDRMQLTTIPETPDGDTYFPEWDVDDWEQVDEETLGDGLTVRTYQQR